MKFCHKNIIFIILCFIVSGCTNPFAPRLTEGEAEIITDQKTIDGLFENFRYSYIFKDTLVYGRILDDKFTFTFRTYDKSGDVVDISWGRTEDMTSTSGLFAAAQRLDLMWNDKFIISVKDDSSEIDLSRSFNLIIEFDLNYTEQIYGRARFKIIRKSPGDKWLLSEWHDESNF